MRRPSVSVLREPQLFLVLALLIGLSSGLAVVCFRISIEWLRILLLGSSYQPPAIRLLQESGSAVGQLPEPVLHGCLASVVDATRIVRGSRHRRLAGDLTLVVAGAPRKETWLDPAGWSAYTAGIVTTVTLDATHGDLVRRPAVDEVGALLADLVEKSRRDR